MDELIIDIDQRLNVSGIPVYIRSIGYTSQRRSENSRVFPHIVLYYNSEGSSELRINGGDKVTVNKGEWVLIDRNVICSETVYGRCSGYELRIITDPKGSALFPALVRNRCCRGEDDGMIDEMLSGVRREYLDKPRGYKEYSSHLLSAAIIMLSRKCGVREYCADLPESGGSGDTGIIEAFFDRVYCYESDGLTIDSLANELHMSKRNVNRVLNKWYGMSFQQLLLSAKLRFASHLLIQSDRKVSEICDICGLSEPYFIRCFKTGYGMTPAQYRKKNKK